MTVPTLFVRHWSTRITTQGIRLSSINIAPTALDMRFDELHVSHEAIE
jgi:hypothetical protein